MDATEFCTRCWVKHNKGKHTCRDACDKCINSEACRTFNLIICATYHVEFKSEVCYNYYLENSELYENLRFWLKIKNGNVGGGFFLEHSRTFPIRVNDLPTDFLNLMMSIMSLKDQWTLTTFFKKQLMSSISTLKLNEPFSTVEKL